MAVFITYRTALEQRCWVWGSSTFPPAPLMAGVQLLGLVWPGLDSCGNAGLRMGSFVHSNLMESVVLMQSRAPACLLLT